MSSTKTGSTATPKKPTSAISCTLSSTTTATLPIQVLTFPVEQTDLRNVCTLSWYTDSFWEIGNLPKPDRYHHIVEDFLTDWYSFPQHKVWWWFYSLYVLPRTSRLRHVLPLRRFLESIVGQDLRRFLPETCFQVSWEETPISHRKTLFLVCVW